MTRYFIKLPEEIIDRHDSLHYSLNLHLEDMIAGWSSLVARRAHNPEAAGSNPAPATNIIKGLREWSRDPFFVF